MASSQKFGRHSKRSPSAARYKAERRWERNARLAGEKETKRKAHDAAKTLVVAHGATRAARRASDPLVLERKNKFSHSNV